MNTSRVGRVLDIAANLAAVLICIAVLVTVGQTRLLRNSVEDTGLRVGSPFRSVPQTTFSDHQLTVALFLSSRCMACRDSVEQYQELQRLIPTSGNAVKLVGVFRDAAQEIPSLGLAGLHAVQADDFDSYRVSGTPTVVLVGKDGKVKDFWIGKMTANARAELTSIIKKEIGKS